MHCHEEEEVVRAPQASTTCSREGNHFRQTPIAKRSQIDSREERTVHRQQDERVAAAVLRPTRVVQSVVLRQRTRKLDDGGGSGSVEEILWKAVREGEGNVSLIAS